mgnify:CR=1 FL=1
MFTKAGLKLKTPMCRFPQSFRYSMLNYESRHLTISLLFCLPFLIMDDTEIASLLKEHNVVLLEFHAAWCEPCKWAEPVIKEVMHHFKENLHLHKIDIDEQPVVSKEFSVLSVPTFVLMKGGSEVWRMRGFEISPVMIRSLQPYVS